MTTAPAETTATNIKTPKIDMIVVREVLPTTHKNLPALEFDFRARGKYWIDSTELSLIALLEPIGFSYHGGKFYFKDALLNLNEPLKIDLEMEINNQFGGRKLKSARQLPADAIPPVGMNDDEFSRAWDTAAAVVPPLDRVDNDAAMWGERLLKIIVRFYSLNGYGPNAGKTAGESIRDQTANKAETRKIRFAQDLLKKKIREDFPEGCPMAKKAETQTQEFDKTGSAAEVGMRIIDEAKKRKLESGPTLEVIILGERAEKFVTTPQSYKAALDLVAHHFANVDEESAFLLGISKNEAEVGLTLGASEAQEIFQAILVEYTAGSTDDLLDISGYDRSVVLAAHRSAIERYIVRNVPKFENGTKDNGGDFDLLHRLNGADIKDPDPVGEAAAEKTLADTMTAPPDATEAEATAKIADAEKETEDINEMEQGMADKPAEPAAEPAAEDKPKFTAEEWTKWLKDQRQDYKELSAADIMAILKIERASQFKGTLKDANEQLKRAMEVKRTEGLVEDAKRILKDKGVPLEEWERIITEAGDPKLFTETSYDREKFSEKIFKLANAYMVAASTPKTESALVPINPGPDKALTVPAQAYDMLTSLGLPTPAELDQIVRVSEFIVGCGLFRGVDTVPRAVAIILKAKQMKLGAVEAFENVWVIPSKKGDQLYPSTDLLRGRVMANPICKRFDVVGDDKKATAVVWRAGDPEPVTFTYTIEDARTAGLLETYENSGDLKKQNWNSPSIMLKHRVGRMAVKAKFPDVAIGLLPHGEDE